MGDGCLQSLASKFWRGSYEKMRPVPRKAGIRCPLSQPVERSLVAFTLAFVQLIANAFMSRSETKPPNTVGTLSSLAAIRRADYFAVVEAQRAHSEGIAPSTRPDQERFQAMAG